MKKTIFYVLTIIFVLSFAEFSYADSIDTPVVEVEVTGGVDFDKEKISTFDDAKTISGTADEGTVIDIVVYKRFSNDKLRETSSYYIEVGESGLFSQAVDLSVGENYIEFCASKKDCDNLEYGVTVNRKKKSIKMQLESSIYIPGGTLY